MKKVKVIETYDAMTVVCDYVFDWEDENIEERETLRLFERVVEYTEVNWELVCPIILSDNYKDYVSLV